MKKKIPKVAISGYYGFNNCGDEAVLLAMIHCLNKLEPDAEITVFSNSPAATRSTYGVEAAYRWNPFSVAFRIMTCDLLISGGGSLLQDITSSRSVKYYLAVIKTALFFKKKVMIYSQGIGPLNNEKNREKTLKVLSRCNAVTVRDDLSSGFLKVLGLGRDVHVVSDPVMAFGREDIDGNVINDLLRETGVQDSDGGIRKPLLYVSVRLWKDNAFFAPAAKLLDAQVEKGWDVLLVPAHFPADMDAASKLRSMMSLPSYAIDKCLTASQFLALAARADKVFSMRLHGLICAMAMGVPMLALSYDPKVDGFMEQAGLERFCLPCDDFDLAAAEALLEELDAVPPEVVKKQTTRRAEMRELAWVSARKAVELLQK